MKRIFSLVLCVAFISAGCIEGGSDLGSWPSSGRTTMNTRYFFGRPTGFSFSLGRSVTITFPLSVVPDLLILVGQNDTLGITGVFLGPVIWQPTFRLMYASDNLDSASFFFTRLREVPDSLYTELALPLTPGQVWAIKTHDNKYAKILIRHTLAYDDSSSPTAPPYGEATFDWLYQSDGTRRF